MLLDVQFISQGALLLKEFIYLFTETFQLKN